MMMMVMTMMIMVMIMLMMTMMIMVMVMMIIIKTTTRRTIRTPVLALNNLPRKNFSSDGGDNIMMMMMN